MRFSVIIPACNVGGYIACAAASVRNQDFPDFEALIICETSSDNTVAEAKKISACDDRFTVFELPRSGSASVPRNYGMDHAAGDYLVFLDGDDALEPGSLTALDEAIRAHSDPDIVACEYRNFRNGVPCGGEKPHQHPGRVLAGTEALTEFLTDGSYRSATWRNVFKRTLLTDPVLRQPPGRRHQDDEWTPRVFCAAGSVLVSGILLCDYRRRSGSVTTTPSEASAVDMADNLASMLDFLNSSRALPVPLMRRMAEWQLRVAAGFYGSNMGRLYSETVRRRELTRVMRGRYWKLLRLSCFAGPRHMGFALLARVLPWRAATGLHKLLFEGRP